MAAYAHRVKTNSTGYNIGNHCTSLKFSSLRVNHDNIFAFYLLQMRSMKDKKMTMYEFKLLPEPEQYELIYLQGTFLDIQLAPPHTRFTLYALFRFYVEVGYNLETKKIVGKKEFIYGDVMDKYVPELPMRLFYGD